MVVRHKVREIARPLSDTRPLKAESHWTENFFQALLFFHYTCVPLGLAAIISISHVDCRPVNKHIFFSPDYSAASWGPVMLAAACTSKSYDCPHNTCGKIQCNVAAVAKQSAFVITCS